MPHHHLSPLVQSDEDRLRLQELRRDKPARQRRLGRRGLGAVVADGVANIVGSWRFIILQSLVLGGWILANSQQGSGHWDPYPFILLNLILSFQAAYAAPIIMMSQNRQSVIDRLNAENDYKINVKAELEIEALHAKNDALREQEILRLTRTIEELVARLPDASSR